MFIQEISIDIRTKANGDEIIEEFDLLMSFYRGNGQTQGKIESQYINEDDKIVCLPFTLEEKSLDKKYNNFYVERQTKKVEELCNSKLNFKIVGKTFPSYQGTCNCEKSNFYILITNYLTISSPLTCGNCDKPIPLYKLPKYTDHSYIPILGWETNYVSCDSLQMNCQVGERWALNQMENFKSQLSKQGLKICRTLEEKTEIPVYYYLHNYSKYRDEKLLQQCPICNENWRLSKQLNGLYDFKCSNCHIISTLPSKS